MEGPFVAGGWGLAGGWGWVAGRGGGSHATCWGGHKGETTLSAVRCRSGLNRTPHAQHDPLRQRAPTFLALPTPLQARRSAWLTPRCSPPLSSSPVRAPWRCSQGGVCNTYHISPGLCICSRPNGGSGEWKHLCSSRLPLEAAAGPASRCIVPPLLPRPPTHPLSLQRSCPSTLAGPACLRGGPSWQPGGRRCRQTRRLVRPPLPAPAGTLLACMRCMRLLAVNPRAPAQRCVHQEARHEPWRASLCWPHAT